MMIVTFGSGEKREGGMWRSDMEQWRKGYAPETMDENSREYPEM